MKIQIRADRKLSTTLYRKPTDCVVLLQFHSNHSLKGKESIIFSQTLRYNLLIADNNLLQIELDSLTMSLLARKYPLDIITHNISKVLFPSRETLLHEPPRNQFPEQSSQLWPHTQKKVSVSPSQYETVGVSLKMTPNYTASGPINLSLLTTRLNPLRTS